MRRSGWPFLKLIFVLITEGSGAHPKLVGVCPTWWVVAPPVIASRLTMSSKRGNAPSPVTVVSDATGEGGPASLSFLSTSNKSRPIVFGAQADDKLRDVAARSNKIYIFGLFAAKATVFQLRGEP